MRRGCPFVGASPKARRLLVRCSMATVVGSRVTPHRAHAAPGGRYWLSRRR